MIASLVLALAMLTPADAGTLKQSRLTPNANNAIATIARARPVVLARFTFATYTGPITTPVSIATILFPAGVLQPGDQFKVEIGGTASNTSTASVVGAIVQISQGGLVQNIGAGAGATLPNTGGTPVAWFSWINFGVNVPGADGQYLQPISALSSQSGTLVQPRNLPNASIGFAGLGAALVSDTSTSGGLYAGGILIGGAAAQTSRMLSTKAELDYSNQQPIQMDVILFNLTPTSNVITVQSGTFIGL
jgi:hypothetical protein